MIFRILEEQVARQTLQSKTTDRRFMDLALALGRRGLGRTSPNPSVGAVLVRDGIVVGRGRTRDGGRPHAEPEALAQAGDAARGATLYVTLEPCSHAGKSPPCTDAIIAAGVSRVVSSLDDPNPLVAGQGHAKLRAAGIAVEVGLRADTALQDHAGHIRRMRDGRPHTILKLAVSSDNRIGAKGRKKIVLTGDAARAQVHLLRAQCDAILVGVGTALADDPLLTCRLPGMDHRSPVRIVMDGASRLPSDSRLLQTARDTPLWIFTAQDADAAAVARVETAGAAVIGIGRKDAGLDPLLALQELSRRGVTRLLLEGGSRVAAAFLAADLVDEFWLFRADATVGDSGVEALDGMRLDDAIAADRFRRDHTAAFGADVLSVYKRS